ncbi:MAG: hypothetical protein ACOYOL_11315 [Chthoniobacterales bacterium]
MIHPRIFLLLGLAGSFLCICTTAGAGESVRYEGSKVLRSENVRVEIVDPAVENRCSPVPRFTPVAAVLRATVDGLEYLFDPLAQGLFVPGKLTDSDVAGLWSEFDLDTPGGPPGFSQAKPGEGFLKVGVGVLKRPDSEGYYFARNYEILSPAKTTVAWEKDGAVFRQTSEGTSGYAYDLDAAVKLEGKTITVSWELENTGERPLTTVQYSHNCFAFDGRTVGPGYTLSFPYDFTAKGLNPEQEQAGRSIVFKTRIPTYVNAVVDYPPDYKGPNAAELRHEETGQFVKVTTSIPGQKTAIHARHYYLNPEQFVEISLKPGEKKRWVRTYEFGLGKAASAPPGLRDGSR